MLAGKGLVLYFGGPVVSGRLHLLRCRFYWELRVIAPSQQHNMPGARVSSGWILNSIMLKMLDIDSKSV
jgi:hypothetical protein